MVCKLLLLGAVIATVGLASLARAQSYYSPGDDPCQPVRVTPLGALFSGDAMKERQAACVEERKAQWSNYYAQQEQARQEKAAQEARQSEENRRQAEIAKQQERSQAKKRWANYKTMVALEQAPDNRCRVPDVARMMMDQWNDFDTMKNNGVKVVDIEHLITVLYDSESAVLACHGVFVTNKGFNVAGTLSMKKNVAGDPIFNWSADVPQDFSQYVEPPNPEADETIPQAAPVVDQTPSQSVNVPFSNGLTDRKQWESWLAGLTGPEKDGAIWWASNRNSPHHQTCTTAPSKDDATWEAGCMNAQLKLTPVDLKRRSDPQYKSGWNSL